MPQAVGPTFWVGTSGYNYAEWKGSFYPERFSSKKMLPYYAERLPTVEINYTFYRMPTERLLAGWAEVTPEEFRFTLKAPRRITHDARLQHCEELTRTFCDAAGTLGSPAPLQTSVGPGRHTSRLRVSCLLAYPGRS